MTWPWVSVEQICTLSVLWLQGLKIRLHILTLIIWVQTGWPCSAGHFFWYCGITAAANTKFQGKTSDNSRQRPQELGVPILMGTWAPRASSPSSRACSSWWKSVFSFAPPAPSASRALPLRVTPHQMSWRKQKKNWKTHKIKGTGTLTGVRGKALLGVGQAAAGPGDSTLMWAQCLGIPRLSAKLRVPIPLRAGLFPARIMRRHLCPTAICSMSCFGTLFSYRTLPTATRAMAGSGKMVFMPS